MGYHQGSILIGASLGPIFGGYLSDHLGFRAPFFIYGALVGCGALWTCWRMKERNGRRQETLPGKAEAEREGRKVKLLEIIFERNLVLANLVTFAVFFTRAGAQLMIIPLFGYGVAALTSSQVGTALTSASLLNLVTMFTSGKQTQRFGRKRMIVFGAAVAALSLVFFPFLAHGLWSYLACTIFYGLGTGIVVPALAAYVVDTPATAGRYGIAMGVYRTYGDVGYILAPMLMGWLSDVTHGYVWPLLLNGLMMGLMGTLFWARGIESTHHQQVSVEQLPLS
jgi:MFS family permease